MNVIYIDSLERPELAPYARLTEGQLLNRLHPEEGLFICESEKVIRVALEHGVEPVSFLCEEKFLEQVEEISGKWNPEGELNTLKKKKNAVKKVESEKWPVYTGKREVLAQLTGYELSRGVLCCMHRPKLRSVEEVCAGVRRVAVMDSVVNSTNTGAIFRAAASLGVDALLLTRTCCDPLNRRACRVSMGTVFQVPWAWLDSYNQLKDLGFQTVALALTERSVRIDDPVLKTPERLAIIMGTEGDGLSDSVLRQCDYVAKIPMQRGVDSLNVAAAASVAFWELLSD